MEEIKTKVVKIDDISDNREALFEAAELIKNGKLVVFPTETVYGLGGNALLENAANDIYKAKGRPSDNPLIIHIAEPEDAEKYAYTNEIYYKLAKAFMPGPITIILKKKDCIPYSVTGGLDTVAVRCPSHKVAHELIKLSGVPICAPSANLSGKPSPTEARYVIEDMFGRVDMIIDGGPSEIGLESTIVMIDNDGLTLLRPGGITIDDLTKVSNNVKIAKAVTEMLSKDEKVLSPGMKYKHYAPNTPFILLEGKENDVLNFLIEEQKKGDCAVLCFDDELPFLSKEKAISVGSRENLANEASKLFTALRDADKLQVSVIYGHLPPKDGIGLALYNRMIRASAHTIRKI